MATKKENGIVNIHGKEYQTVAYRVQVFRDKYPDYTLQTDVIFRDDDTVVMKAVIADTAGRTIATGHAEEKRNASHINKTSALENAETSAIGRCLASFGMGGTEFATADEVANAIQQQQTGPKTPPKTNGNGLISDAQRKRMFAIAKGHETVLREVLGRFGYEHTTDVKTADYDKIITETEIAIKGGF